MQSEGRASARPDVENHVPPDLHEELVIIGILVSIRVHSWFVL